MTKGIYKIQILFVKANTARTHTAQPLFTKSFENTQNCNRIVVCTLTKLILNKKIWDEKDRCVT